MDEVQAHQIFDNWSTTHWHRAVPLNGDFAPEEEAEQWLDELLTKALVAMADAGIEVARGPLRLVEDTFWVEIDKIDLAARDLAHGPHPSLDIEVILARLDDIAADHKSRARWHFWYTGDPVGAGFFVSPEDLITTAGVDVRQLNTGVQWYRPDPHHL